jgi:hypothetical protein
MADRSRDLTQVINTRTSWIRAFAALGIMSVTYGAPFVAVVALKPIGARGLYCARFVGLVGHRVPLPGQFSTWANLLLVGVLVVRRQRPPRAAWGSFAPLTAIVKTTRPPLGRFSCDGHVPSRLRE